MEYEQLEAFIRSLLIDDIIKIQAIIGKAHKGTDVRASGEIIKRERSNIACKGCNTVAKRNGHTKDGRQKYICPRCGKSFSNTTGTILKTTNYSFEKWIRFIYLELLGLTIRAIANDLRMCTSEVFLWRIKLYKAISAFKSKISLSGVAQIDGYFVASNFKGSREKDMPRKSLKRGSRRSKGVAHKVCVLSGVDDNDNMFFEITGIGEETEGMMNKIHDKIKNIDLLVCDCKAAFIGWANRNKKRVETVKSKTYSSINGYNLNEINGLHSELTIYLAERRGVSTRHLQEYLDMFLFKKYLSYHIEMSIRDVEAFDILIPTETRVVFKEVFKEALPVDFSTIYGKNQ